MLTDSTGEQDKPLELVWDLSDKSMLADGIWFLGQVEVFARQVKIQAVKGDDVGGWAAIDDIEIVETSPCDIFPESAAIPTEPPTQPTTESTTQTLPSLDCDFEYSDCGWVSNTVGDSDNVWWNRKSSNELNEGEGPDADFTNNKDGRFKHLLGLIIRVASLLASSG